jgi:peptide subunit release factor 1 (eRF1)
VPTDRVDKSVPGHAQRHRLTHLQWHLKTTAQHAYHLFAEQECEVLVVMGEERIQSLLDEFLHETLKGKIVGRIHGSPVADPRARQDLINQALRDHKIKRETSAMHDLGEHKPDALVSGLRRVIDALNFFLVRDLFVAEGLQQRGVVCRQHHYIALEGTECPFCGAKLLSVDNVIDEIVEVARLHGVKVTIIEHRQDLLSKYDGIAATVYVQPAQDSAAA